MIKLLAGKWIDQPSGNVVPVSLLGVLQPSGLTYRGEVLHTGCGSFEVNTAAASTSATPNPDPNPDPNPYQVNRSRLLTPALTLTPAPTPDLNPNLLPNPTPDPNSHQVNRSVFDLGNPFATSTLSLPGGTG